MKSYEEVKSCIEGAEGNGCELITEKTDYINTHTKILIRCKCGNIYKTTFKDFTRKKQPQKQCPSCGIKNMVAKRIKSLETIKQEIKDKFGEGYTVIGEYKGVNSPLAIRHSCGYEWKPSVTNLLKSKGCPYCNGYNKNMDTEIFKRKVFDLVGDEYSVVGEYTKAINKLTIKHNKCKRLYEVSPHEFMNGNARCPMCWNENKKGKLQKDNNIFEKELFNKYKNEYKLIGNYKGARIKTKIQHTICGNIYNVTPDNILRGKSCPYCAKHPPLDDIAFKNRIEKLYPDEYTIIGKYTTMHNKIKVKHNICGTSWFTEPNSLMRNNVCPHCSSSKGEKRIERFLKLNHIKYTKQYYFKDCKVTRKPLLFDFAIFTKKDKLKCCIEYDGIQHYEDVPIFGGKKAFVDTLYRDTVKNDYCKKHKIKLIRIPYWDYDNIEKILNNL